MFAKEIEFPRQFRFVESKPARNRIYITGMVARFLDTRNQIDRLLFIFLAVFLRSSFIEPRQLLVTQIFLHDDSAYTVDGVNLRNRNAAVKEQSRHIEVRMNVSVKRLRIDGRDSGAMLPGHAKVTSRLSIRR